MVGTLSWMSKKKSARARSKKTAIQRGLEWDLSEAEWAAIRKLDCHYCSFPIETATGGLDRINSSKGYTADNVLPACKECNVARNDHFTVDEMLVIGKAIAQVKLTRLVKNGVIHDL